MVAALTTLIACQFVGEVAARAGDLPIPGPVVGLLLMLLFLSLRGGPNPALRETSIGLLRYLSLLFVPAGVGVVTQLDVLGANLLPVVGAILVSTALGLAATGLVMQAIARRGSGA